MATEEGWHTVEDGKKLYTKTWKTEGPAKARVVFVHGFSDHCNTYYNLFGAFASKGIETYSFDQRGWGRSVSKPAEKGMTGPTSRVIDDITSFIKSVTPSPIPLFLIGHSMGGGEVLYYAARGPAEIRKQIRGYMLIAPFVDFTPSTKPSGITVVLGRLVGKLMPHRQMVNPLDSKFISRDPAIQKQFVEDALCHDTGTLEGLAGMLDRTAELSSGKVVIGDDAGEGGVTRIWVGHGEKDGLVNYEASKQFVEKNIKAQDKEFKSYEGHFHRLHDEPDPHKETVHKDMIDWLLARSVEPVQADAGKPKL